VTRLATALVVVLALAGRSPAADPPKTGEYTAELNGLKLWYKVSGKGPVCLVPSPAWGVSSDLYFRTLKPLERFFTVVYLDSRGTGRSAKAKTSKDYTWELLVSDLEALRAHLGQDRVWLMGHSEGGIVSAHYACEHPDRVAGLVLLAASAAMGPKDDADATARVMKRKDEPWFAAAMLSQLAGPPKTDEEMAAGMEKLLPAYWADPSRIAKYKDDFAASTMSVAARAGSEDSKRRHFDLTGRLKKVTAPALVVVGDRDFVCPPHMSRTLHLGLANSKLLVIEDCGHFPWMEQAKEFEVQVPLFLKALGLSEQAD